MRDSGDYLFTSEIGVRRPSGQGLRPDLRHRRRRLSGGDPEARVACETLATTNRVVIAGEVRGPGTRHARDIRGLAREAIKDIGYEQDGFPWKNADVEVLLHGQSADIAKGVDAAGNKDEGAGDQGIMFGYACSETPSADAGADLLRAQDPRAARRARRKAGDRPVAGLQPDAKSQVTVRYENGKPVGATQIVVSTQHDEAARPRATIRDDRRAASSKSACRQGWMPPRTQIYVNPTGNFVIGGPDGDCRPDRPQDHRRHLWRRGPAWRRRLLAARTRPRSTARRPMPRAISPRTSSPPASPSAAPSSSPTRSASPSRCRSMSTLHGTGKVDEAKLEKRAARAGRPVARAASASISTSTSRSTPRTAAYGHFGRTPEADGGFSWEKTDLGIS